jgi:hypothetical protein
MNLTNHKSLLALCPTLNTLAPKTQPAKWPDLDCKSHPRPIESVSCEQMFPFSNSVWKPCEILCLYKTPSHISKTSLFQPRGSPLPEKQVVEWKPISEQKVLVVVSARKKLLFSLFIARRICLHAVTKNCHSLCKRHCIVALILELEIGSTVGAVAVDIGMRCSAWWVIVSAYVHSDLTTVKNRCGSCKPRRYFTVTVLVF